MTPVVTWGPGATIILDEEFRDSVRRHAALRQQLKLAAEKTAKQRGHKLEPWGGSTYCWSAHCTICGMSVTVETAWPEITGSATGTALTSDCVPLA